MNVMSAPKDAPEMVDTGARVQAARDALTQADARLSEHIATASNARRLVDDLNAKVRTEKQALAEARQSHAEALVAGTATPTHSEAVRHHETTVSSLQDLLATETARADALDRAIGEHRQAMAGAQTALERADYYHLVATYLEAIRPAIPIAREIHAKAQLFAIRFGLNTFQSGFLLDPQHPTVGRYSIDERGQIFVI